MYEQSVNSRAITMFHVKHLGGEKMPSDLPIITLRLSVDENKKIKYIANEHCRKINDEIRMLVKKHIANYETENGEIKLDK